MEDEIIKLFQAGVHLGHKKNRLHPKAKKFIYKIINGIAIIDLTTTAKSLNKIKEFLKDELKKGKKILVVATKKIISQYAAQLCQENKVSYITTKWLPGLLTNFETIINNVKKLKQLQQEKEEGIWDKYPKHERVKLNKNFLRLKKLYGGLVDLEKRPDLLLIVDIKKEKNALNEAKKTGIPTIAIVDTNSNPDLVEYPIVANDDSASSLQFLLSKIISAVIETKN